MDVQQPAFARSPFGEIEDAPEFRFGKTGGGRGETTIDAHGGAWWRPWRGEPWQEAVFHSVIRPNLIEEATHQGSYNFPRKVGPLGPSDITSYHPGQDWGLDRDFRPPKTFQFQRSRDTEPSHDLLRWKWHGRIVLDFNGFPIFQNPALPATIGSKEEGCFLEGMFREDPNIKWHDVAARMPVTHPPMIYTCAVNMTTVLTRRTKFRLLAGCFGWKENKGATVIRAELEKIIPPCFIQANSTREFRDLTPSEIKQVQLAGKKARCRVPPRDVKLPVTYQPPAFEPGLLVGGIGDVKYHVGRTQEVYVSGAGLGNYDLGLTEEYLASIRMSMGGHAQQNAMPSWQPYASEPERAASVAPSAASSTSSAYTSSEVESEGMERATHRPYDVSDMYFKEVCADREDSKLATLGPRIFNEMDWTPAAAYTSTTATPSSFQATTSEVPSLLVEKTDAWFNEATGFDMTTADQVLLFMEDYLYDPFSVQW
ncbi:MAG: hypothetical protein Q9166_005653 [cf. Caloplaca sp. 2 TL-2023]